MGSRGLLSFADALTLLGVDSARITALDRAVGGALNLATGGASGTLLGMVSGRGRIIGAGRDAVHGVAERLGRAGHRAERTEVLRAAHTVIVVVAWFEALDEARLPFSLDDVELTRGEQLRLVGADGRAGDDLVRELLAADVLFPAPHHPPEALAVDLESFYASVCAQFRQFLTGLRVWERLQDQGQFDTMSALNDALVDDAVRRYADLYAQLALAAPEFNFWITQNEHQATRAEVRRALDGVRTLLAESAAHLAPPADVAAALARAHTATLGRPVLDATTAPEGIRVPSLREMYLDPDFRVAQPQGQSGPADESWWQRFGVRQDLTRYLAGALTNPALAQAPLLVLGQPGAGKSVLTRVLAARLPEAGFLPVRVPLRDVRAEDELQDQIELAVRVATGERTSWPELVRSAGGSTPVLLLDGFDELLQTTGVHHNDFLIRVARFQRREAEQGRSVLAVVTSRTTVADRARYPEGLVALRLEPFRPAQIQRWLSLWNDANAHVLAPLTWEAVAQHAELASQPLLLTMLALYDATEGGLNRDGSPLAVTELYEELLSSFARREVGKSTRDAVPDTETAARVERELQRLSLVAFALLNRHRQWVSAAELEDDLVALLGRDAAASSGFRAPLGAAEIALGRFFFVQRSQSVRSGQVLSTYEFLHATFGEYLAVRLAVRLLTDLMAQRPGLSLGESRIDDELAYALLSYAPLASRQMLRFLRELAGRIPQDEREPLARQLIRVLRGHHRTRTSEEYPAYRPDNLRTAARHGLYESNLVLMVLVLRGRTTAAELFPDAQAAVHRWGRHCLLWRSAMDEAQWTDFALSFTTRRHWGADGTRALEIVLRDDRVLEHPRPIDANWLFGFGEGAAGRTWQRTYWDEMWHKVSVAGTTTDSIVRHTLDPVFANLGVAVTTFTPLHGEPATSVANSLMRLVLDDVTALPDAELDDLHARVMRGLEALSLSSPQTARLLDVLVTAHRRDRDRLSEEVVARLDALVRSLTRLRGDSADSLRPVIEVLRRHYPEEFDHA
ncbi:NACHT domain-containing protein [Streptomyces sp. NPDC088785]|uniref:NACHT domain-containing protein n=1 Tax=Streptomyces sp. NPDC088785 TaxID=3365897 RepID=UPI0037FD34C0